MSGDAPWTLDDVHRAHPWPARWGEGRLIEFLWHHELRADPEVVWRLTSDTSRLNRALGTTEFHFEERGAERHGWSRSGGRRHEWLEVPWNWVAGEWLECVRVYQRGYPRVMHSVQRVEALAGGGARFTAYFGFLPRGRLGALVLRFGFASLGKAYARVLTEVDQQWARSHDPVPAALIAPPPALGDEARDRLRAIAAELERAGLDGDAVTRLAALVAEADDADLHRIQPRERARAWGLDEDVVLRTCLHATRAGLLDLSWDVVCPHCRGVRGEHRTLAAVPTRGECQVCAVEFGTDRDNAVEITFRVHRSIRDVPTRFFCSAEPAHKDHIRVQHALGPGAAVEVAPVLGRWRYRTRLIGHDGHGYLDVAERGDASVEWRASAGPAEHHDVIDAPRLVLRNDTDREQTFVIEEARWTDVALRPGRLLSFQEFRDLFSEEYLGADVQLAIGEQTILFTDMVGSTALYATRGDPAAFVEVRKHFAEVFALIGEHRGAVVKTIGDAAMGAFNDPLDAVRCARAIHASFPPGRADSVARLRISLNTGPCIAVRLNANIDYFGGTVNVAAKLQAMAESWQIAMSAATWSAPGVAAWLDGEGATLDDLSYTSPALVEPIAVKRWTVYAADGG